MDNGIFVNNCLHFLVCIIFFKQNVASRNTNVSDSEIKLLAIYFGKNHVVTKQFCQIMNKTARGKPYIVLPSPI